MIAVTWQNDRILSYLLNKNGCHVTFDPTLRAFSYILGYSLEVLNGFLSNNRMSTLVKPWVSGELWPRPWGVYIYIYIWNTFESLLL